METFNRSVVDCGQLGNAAKMREVVAETEKRIDKVISILTEIPDNCGYGGLLEDAADELCDLKEEFVKPALSAPARNCDRFSDLNTAQRYYIEHGCPKGLGMIVDGEIRKIPWKSQFEKWLFAEAKGETK